MRCLLVTVPFASLLLAVPAAAQDRTPSAELEGTWKLVKIDRTGTPKTMDTESPEFFRLNVLGNKFAIQHRQGTEEATFQVPSAAWPQGNNPVGVKPITIRPTTGDEKGTTILGIYQRKGGDLTLAVSEPDSKDRPTAFKGVSKKVTVFYLKRESSSR